MAQSSQAFSFDADFDLRLGAGGDIELVDGPAAVFADIAYRLVDELQSFVGTRVDKNARRDLRNTVQSIVRNDPRVENINRLQISEERRERSLTIAFDLQIDGDSIENAVTVI